MRITESSITVKDINIYAHHGVQHQERVVGNDFLVSLTLYFKAESAMKYDDIRQTINYAEVVQLVKDVMVVPSLLIESAAWRLIKSIIEAFPLVTSGSVSVTKIHPPMSAQIGGATFTASFVV